MSSTKVTCSRCSRAIQAGETYYSDVRDASVCPSCYSAAIKTCADCGQPIPPTVQVFKTYQGKNYHTDCFRCAACGTSLGAKAPPTEVGGVAYCSSCGVSCARCHQPVKNQFMEINNQKYHKGCYTCFRCGSGLEQECYMVGENISCKSCAES